MHPFVATFADFWQAPSPERLPELLHPQVRLIQPLAEPMNGIAAVATEFAALWKWLPDMTAEVDRWHGDDEVVFIEFRLRATLGNGRREIPCVDRFLLDDGKAVERVAYFDPLPLIREVSKRPSTWSGWWRSGVARPWRSGHRSMTSVGN